MGRAIPVDLGVIKFTARSRAHSYFHELLFAYKPGDRVCEDYKTILIKLLERHPDSAAKIGEGVSHFEVIEADYGTQCFAVFRTDGSYEKFSYHTCVDKQ